MQLVFKLSYVYKKYQFLQKNLLGDKNLKDPLYLLGGTGVFTK